MSYPSVDALQKALARKVFSNRTDAKKASGRALGTIVEIITFYLLRCWGFQNQLSIEKGLAEFANDKITHNVEFGLHSLIKSCEIGIPKGIRLPITCSKIRRLAGLPELSTSGSVELLSSKGVLRNACTVHKDKDSFVIATLLGFDDLATRVQLSTLSKHPFAMVECKRVGVEDGMLKGPTTIEKAKQGAYVAKHVSSLQKIRGRDGVLYGVMPKKDGTFEINPFKTELRRIINDVPLQELDGFILTLGIVSNHGNWFTRDNMNKELLVLKDSYDWLLFLSDEAIAEFVTDTILSPDSKMSPVRNAFSETYADGRKGSTRFTKVKIDLDAHNVLSDYFYTHLSRIEKNWFNVLSPDDGSVGELTCDLRRLASKVHD